MDLVSLSPFLSPGHSISLQTGAWSTVAPSQGPSYSRGPASCAGAADVADGAGARASGAAEGAGPVACEAWLHDRPTLAIAIVRTTGTPIVAAFLRFIGGAGDARAIGATGMVRQTVCTNARKGCRTTSRTRQRSAGQGRFPSSGASPCRARRSLYDRSRAL